MPSDLSIDEQVIGRLVSYDGQFAKGWIKTPYAGAAFLVLRLDEFVVGSGLATKARKGTGLRAPKGYTAFALTADFQRVVSGGQLRIEWRFGSELGVLAGAILIAQTDIAAIEETDRFAFQKANGLRVAGWYAHKTKAPLLEFRVGNSEPKPLLATDLSPEAGRAGGVLAAGYHFSIDPGQFAGDELDVSVERDGVPLWTASFNPFDRLMEEGLRAVEFGSVSTEFIVRFAGEFAALTPSSPGFAAAGGIALELLGDRIAFDSANAALDLALQFGIDKLLRASRRSFLERMSMIMCALDRAGLRKFHRALNAMGEPNLKDPFIRYISSLIGLRLNESLAVGSAIAEARSMGLNQDTMNAAIEVLHAWDAGSQDKAALRQALDLAVIARHSHPDALGRLRVKALQ
jgi:hypothetical protein